jgi:hypothetical protein
MAYRAGGNTHSSSDWRFVRLLMVEVVCSSVAAASGNHGLESFRKVVYAQCRRWAFPMWRTEERTAGGFEMRGDGERGEGTMW